MGYKLQSGREQVMAQLRRNAQRAVTRSALLVQASIRRGLMANGSGKYGDPSPAGSPPGNRTGGAGLAGSITIETLNNGMKANIGTNKVYARIQEFGGHIVSRGKKLTVPISKEGRKYGTVGAAMADGAFVIKRKGKPWLVVKSFGRKGESGVRLLFSLMTAVTLPARPYIRPGFDAAKAAVNAEFAKITQGVRGL